VPYCEVSHVLRQWPQYTRTLMRLATAEETLQDGEYFGAHIALLQESQAVRMLSLKFYRLHEHLQCMAAAAGKLAIRQPVLHLIVVAFSALAPRIGMMLLELVHRGGVRALRPLWHLQVGRFRTVHDLLHMHHASPWTRNH
jgi:hypothetical protein